MIDVIIPVLNEQKFLEDNADYYSELGEIANVIFVDGGSEDSTEQVAKGFGNLIRSRQGRALQKNAGAKMAKTEYLLFAHVDSLIGLDSLNEIEKALSNGYYGGCLTMVVDDRAFIFRFFEFLVNFRAKFLKVLDGDLGQFVRKDIFFKIGEYDKVSSMEDILFGKKLKKIGNIVVLPQKIVASARKWREQGFFNLLGRYSSTYIKLWSGKLTQETKG